jgi:hypothetical protein
MKTTIPAVETRSTTRGGWVELQRKHLKAGILRGSPEASATANLLSSGRRGSSDATVNGVGPEFCQE